MLVAEVIFSLDFTLIIDLCECIVHYDYWNCETIETEDDCAASTAIAFIFLFLITLFYSIGATAVKVK
ncbi:hypothetical protein AAFF_G00215690 [Aldrovandia affinis]|uniref:Uncharacterized protein n=1 Tax=Aldrovandia affinis TaxID=143900 RepID=A0AAD7W4S1_9TELE|nr:hypothetical protein AAFF_G00215690 [Aldrovandia affinis]